VSVRLNFLPMLQLHVDTAALEAMATRWGASAGVRTETAAPTGLDLSAQPSAAAVNAAHADVAVFTADLASRVDMRAKHVTCASVNYIAHDSHAVSELAAVNDSPAIV
jgi:hypothetical protein